MRTRWYRMIMSESNRAENSMFPDEENFCDVDEEVLEQGVAIKGWNSASWIRSTSADHDGPLDDVMFAGCRMTPVFSPGVQHALIDAHVGIHDVQYLPIQVLQSTGASTEGFAIANVVSRVAALDRDRCFLLETDPETLDPLTGRQKIAVIGRIALKARPLVGHHIVRLIEYPRAFLVSDDVVRVFRRHAFTGPLFSQLEVSDD